LQPRRRGGKGQRILYFFRTPPAIRVGRGAIDEDAIRLIEEHNPDVQFDWPRILKQAPEIKSAEADGQRPPRAERAARGPASGRGGNKLQRPPEARVDPAAPAEPAPSADTDSDAAVEQTLVASEENVEAAAFQRLGPEALARLRARYAEIRARISERQMADEEREQLKLEAERLNPDAWVTDPDVDAGLEQYEAVYERIRGVVGHARKRR
jgi:hypothetical protein